MSCGVLKSFMNEVVILGYLSGKPVFEPVFNTR